MAFLLIFIPLILFIILFTIERRTVWIGLFFILLTLYLTVLTVLYLDMYEDKFVISLIGILVGVIILATPFYILSFIIALISSGLQLIKREGRKRHNFLSLASGLFIVFWIVFSSLISVPEEYPFLFSLSFFISSLISYLILVMVSFAVASLLNRFRNPFKSYDYIIVLGSGLIGDRVPPLLASRIDKGIDLFKQHKQKNHPVKLVLTGGQGQDEKVSEGVAMAKYAREKGMDQADIIIEDQAVNTYENILFSKRLIDKDFEKQEERTSPNIITVTNNFHIFRALLWARKVGVKSDGAGSKTKFYFWLNALIREFVGVLYMHRKFHLAAVTLIFILSIFMYLITKFYVLPFV